MTVQFPSSRILGTLLLLVLFGCLDEPADGSTRKEVRGDATFVTIPRGVDTAAVVVDRVETIWQDARLGCPTAIVISGERLAVADQDRLHLLTTGGDYLSTVGTRGSGPEEFGTIAGIGAADDTIVVFDSRNSRLTVLDLEGRLLEARRIQAVTSFPRVRRDAQLRFWNGGMLQVADGIVHFDRPTRSALVWRSMVDDSTYVIGAWDDLQWVDVGRIAIGRGTAPFIGPASAFPPRALIAVSDDGRYALGDGLEYCLSLRRLDGPEVVEICRERPRVAVSDAMLSAPLRDLGYDPGFAEGLASLIRVQEVEKLVPSYDRVMFSEDGFLWVRGLGEDAPHLHPALPESERKAASPQYRRWEALGPEGLTARAVLLPADFDPQLFRADQAFGFLELESGELVVALASWGSAADAMADEALEEGRRLSGRSSSPPPPSRTPGQAAPLPPPSPPARSAWRARCGSRGRPCPRGRSGRPPHGRLPGGLDPAGRRAPW